MKLSQYVILVKKNRFIYYIIYMASICFDESRNLIGYWWGRIFPTTGNKQFLLPYMLICDESEVLYSVLNDQKMSKSCSKSSKRRINQKHGKRYKELLNMFFLYLAVKNIFCFENAKSKSYNFICWWLRGIWKSKNI